MNYGLYKYNWVRTSFAGKRGYLVYDLFQLNGIWMYLYQIEFNEKHRFLQVNKTSMVDNLEFLLCDVLLFLLFYRILV